LYDGCFLGIRKLIYIIMFRNGQNCASNTGHGLAGGWWYNSCTYCHLNSVWDRTGAPWHNNVWDQWKGNTEKLKASLMKIRC